MANLTYTPTEDIIAGSTGILDFELVEDKRTPKAEVFEHTPLNGDQSYRVLHRRERFFNCKTMWLPNAQMKYFHEFQASTANKETFTFDQFGTSVTPDNPITCVVEKGSYSEELFSNKYFSASFRLKVV